MNMKKLTKEDIIEGIDKRVKLIVSEYNAEVIIRPLSDLEISKILLDISEEQTDGKKNLEDDQIEIQKNFQLLRLATVTGLVEPKLTIEEVSKMKYGVPEFIGAKILEISGIVSSDVIQKKRKS